MDDATSEIYSAFFVDEEGTMSSFRALSEVIGARGRFCSLYADRASHYWHTPDAGGTVDKDKPTQVGRALRQLGIELIPAYSPEARGRSERMFGTLQKRLPQELRLAGITGMAEANRFLEEVYLPQHNARFAIPSEDKGSAFVPFAGALDDILCIHEERTVSNDNTVRYRGSACSSRPTAIAATTSRQKSGWTRIQTAPWPSSTAPDAWRDTGPRASPSTRQPGRPREPLRRDRPGACGQVDSRSAPDHFPTGQPQQQKRSTHLVHKPVNSECTRQQIRPRSLDRARTSCHDNWLSGAGFRRARARRGTVLSHDAGWRHGG